MTEPTMNTDPASEKWTNFLMEDYKMKVSYLTGQFGRMWSRFQYFIAFEGLLSTAFFGFIKNGDDATDSDAVWVAATGAAVAACWYVFGAQDKYLVEVYRSQIQHVLQELFERQGFAVPPCAGEGKRQRGRADPCYPYTGGTDAPVEIKHRFLSWRSDRFSITHLAAGFPVIVFVFWAIWVVVLVT